MNPADWNTLLPALPPQAQIILHAPTEQALIRARGNLKNLLAAQPDLNIWIIANAQAVLAVLHKPEDMGTALNHVLLCPNTLKNHNLNAPEDIQVLPMGAVEAIARMQHLGWVYIRS